LSTGLGYDRVYVAIDDATRPAYVEVLADEQQATAIGFLSRALAWFNGQAVDCGQVISDNGTAYLSNTFARPAGVLGFKHIRTRPYTPRTNGMAQRFIQTFCIECAYAMTFQTPEERKAWLPRYLSIYNRIRRHSALGTDLP